MLGKKFRLKFRFPYAVMKQTVRWVKEWRQEKKDCFNRSNVPTEFLVLGTLKILANGEIYDSVSDAACIGVETFRSFFFEFCLKIC